MPPTVAQGASATVSLPAGSNISVTGTGFAVMGVTAGLCRIADAIESLAEAVRESKP